MDVAIAGAHGQIALHLSRMLSARGDAVRGIIRLASQQDDLEEVGARPVVLDLERASVVEVADAIDGADAVVFAAGAGPGSGAARKETVDHEAAVKLRDAAEAADVGRYVMISAMGTDDPPDGDGVFEVYLRAKARADRELMASDLAWTIIRPGRLTNDPGTATVTLGRHVGPGSVPREDVAAVIVAVFDNPATEGQIFEVVSGDTPIADSLAAATG
ncbi:MAG TPA: SDR family oxidoreductase [Euzebyales bacterium]|nr:SDR family oxidoreductase [Euzebyales bacterium]